MNKPFLTILIIAAVVLALAVVIKDRVTSGPAAATSTTPGPESGLVDQATAERLAAIEAREKEADNTIWAKELLAQRYEEFFINLWDVLKTNDNAAPILKQIPLGSVSVPTLSNSRTSLHEVVIESWLGKPKLLSQTNWASWMDSLTAQGFILEQSEWRHVRFDPPGAGPAHSVIRARLHIGNQQKDSRFIVTSDLKIEWATGPDSPQGPTPGAVVPTDTRIVWRAGTPAFQAIAAKTIVPERGSIFIDPLILYDLDGDGLPEIILGCKNLVYWNRGKGEFKSAPLCKQPPGIIYTCLIADFDGDGNADFLAADRDGLLLFHGNERGTFEEAPKRIRIGTDPLLNPFVMTAGDVNGDGSLDVFLAQYKIPYVAGQMPTPYYDANDGFPSFLLLNDGKGNFTDATQSSGLAPKRNRRTYSASLADMDGDGALDLVVVSDFAGLDVYKNDGRGHFTDVTRQWGETHVFGMAHTLADLSGKGRPDLFVVGMNSPTAQRLDHLKLGPASRPDQQRFRSAMAYGNRFYVNSGTGYKEAPFNAEVVQTGWSWGVTAFDFDNSGTLDLAIVNGHKSRDSVREYEPQFWTHDIYAATSAHDPVMDIYFRSEGSRLYGEGRSYGGYEKNRLLMNDGGQLIETAYLFGTSLETDSRNLVSADLTGSGKMDLVFIVRHDGQPAEQAFFIMENQLKQTGNWIGFHLRESGPGFSPIGAVLRIKTPAGIQIRQGVTGDSYRSQHPASFHFGLGAVTNVEWAEVRWPSGKTTRLEKPAINNYHRVKPPAAPPAN